MESVLFSAALLLCVWTLWRVGLLPLFAAHTPTVHVCFLFFSHYFLGHQWCCGADKERGNQGLGLIIKVWLLNSALLISFSLFCFCSCVPLDKSVNLSNPEHASQPTTKNNTLIYKICCVGSNGNSMRRNFFKSKSINKNSVIMIITSSRCGIGGWLHDLEIFIQLVP